MTVPSLARELRPRELADGYGELRSSLSWRAVAALQQEIYPSTARV
jgi:hypothetical protein